MFNIFPFNIGLFNSVDVDLILSLIDTPSGLSAILNPDTTIDDTRQIDNTFLLNDADETSLFFVTLFGQGIFTSGVGTDIVEQIALLLAPVLDSGIGVDNIVSISALINYINDLGVGTEQIVSLVSTISSILDSGIGTELATILSTLSSNDSGIAIDSVSAILASFGITDLGSGLENISVQNFYNVLRMITKMKSNINLTTNMPK